jgi:hypothetical protein
MIFIGKYCIDMLYVSKKAKNVKQNRFNDRMVKKEVQKTVEITPTVVEPAEVKNDIVIEKIEPVQIPVEGKRKIKKTEKVDNIENEDNDGRE